MKRYTNTVLSEATGLSMVGATVTVYEAGTQFKSTLFGSNDTTSEPIKNPVRSDNLGQFGFYAIDGRYDVYVNIGVRTVIVPDVEIVDLVELAQRLEAIENGEPGTTGSLRSDLLSATGLSRVMTRARGAGAIIRSAADKVGERVSVLDYGAVGDGVTDDSTAIMRAINANKGGTIVLPAGKVFLAAGINLDGSSYNGTTIIVEGTFKMKPRASSNDWNWDVAHSPTYNGFLAHDVDGFTFDCPGVIDGNRLAQPNNFGNDQQCHCLQLRGVRNFHIPRFNAREVRGDGITLTTSNNIAPFTINTMNGRIGDVKVINSADDGRNAVSIVSGENISLAGGTSINVGGVIGGERMPGGLDIEPDGNWHKVRAIVSGPWSVTTAGTSGIAVIGKPGTTDAARDWICTDVQIAPSAIILTNAGAGGPIFQRCSRVYAQISALRTGGRQPVADVDFADFVNLSFQISGGSIGVTVGFKDFVNDSTIDSQIMDHSGPGLLSVGAYRTLFTGRVRGGQGAGSYGIQLSAASRGTVPQVGNTYSVDVPYDANTSYGFFTTPGVQLTDCVVCNCSFTGYPGYATMFNLSVFIPTRNVQGRNYASAVPTTGYWAASDIVWNTGTAAGGTPGWVNTAAGQPGTWKALANVAA